MKNILSRIICLLVCITLCLQGCTYHGKIRHNIYRHKDFKEKIDARVMVVSDKFYPKKIAADVWEQYIFQMEDGLPVAVADALKTLFTQAEVNTYEHRGEYDFIAEIDYETHINVGVGRFTISDVMLPYYAGGPLLVSVLKLTMRNPQTGYAVARYEYTSHVFIPTYRNDAGLFWSRLATLLSIGILYPLDMQVFGSKLRKTMEHSINYSLYRHIMPQMKEDRINFTRAHETEKTNTRVDGKFIPFMQATVYITTEDGIGSGFFISPDGYIITNAHVVGHNRDVGVILYDTRHIMDKTHPADYPQEDAIRNKVLFARVLRINKKRDLALLKVEGNNYPWLELEINRKNYATGREVVAIGAPRAIEWTATQGTISATRDDNGRDTVQTDAAINGGNSGGPLIDLKSGKVVGVNSWGRVPSADLEDLQEGAQSLNFAISAYEVQRTLDIHQPMHEDDYPKPTDDNLQTIPKPDINYVQYQEL